MSEYSQYVDNTRFVIIRPEITRAFWSASRAWHGDKMHLHVETRYVPDGTALVLQVWEDDSKEGSPDDFVVEIPGSHVIKNNRCVIDYELKWSKDDIGRDLELEGDSLEFYFLAKIERFGIERRSGLLYVDLHNFLVSQ